MGPGLGAASPSGLEARRHLFEWLTSRFIDNWRARAAKVASGGKQIWTGTRGETLPIHHLHPGPGAGQARGPSVASTE